MFPWCVAGVGGAVVAVVLQGGDQIVTNPMAACSVSWTVVSSPSVSRATRIPDKLNMNWGSGLSRGSGRIQR